MRLSILLDFVPSTEWISVQENYFQKDFVEILKISLLYYGWKEKPKILLDNLVIVATLLGNKEILIYPNYLELL